MADENRDKMRADLLGEIGKTPVRPYELETEEEVEENENEEVEDQVEVNAEDEDEKETSEDDTVEEDSGDDDPEQKLIRETSRLVFGDSESVTVEKDSPPSEVESLKQQVALLTNAILGKTKQDSEEIVDTQPPAEEEFKIDYTAPELIKIFTEKGMTEEDARNFLPVFAGIAEFIGDNKYGKKLSALEAQTQQRRKETEKESKTRKQINNLQTGLAAAKQQGGLEAKIVQDFLTNGSTGKKTLLSEHLRKFPFKMDSVEGVLDAVVSVARSTQLVGTKADPAPTIVGTKKQVSAALGKATNSLHTTNSDEEELTPEEIIKRNIINAGSNSRKLPDAFRG